MPATQSAGVGAGASSASASDMGPPPSTPKRLAGGTHSSQPSSALTQEHHSGYPLPTPPTSHLEDFHSPTRTATPAAEGRSFAAAGASTGAGAGSADDRTPTFTAGARSRGGLLTSPRDHQGHSLRQQQTPTARSIAFARSNPGRSDNGTYTYQDAYTRSRTPSPILPRLQPVPEAASSTGDGHLTFPPFGVSQAQIDSILHDPTTDRFEPSLMPLPDIEALAMSIRQLTVGMANAEDAKLQQLVHNAKTLGEQALGYAQHNASLRQSLNNTRMHAVSAINTLNASASHSLSAERDLRQRLQVELDGERAQSRMLAGRMGRGSRKHEEEHYAGDGSGPEATEITSPSELLKERSKLIADKRFLKSRVKEAEAQALRLESELKALRPHFVRAGYGNSTSIRGHGYSRGTNHSHSHSHGQSHGYIADPFALGSSQSSSQRRRRAATLGDAGSEHLMLAARRYRENDREVHRRDQTAAQEMIDHAASLYNSSMPVYHPYPGYVPPEMPHTVPSSPGPGARAAMGGYALHASGSAPYPHQYGGYPVPDAREGAAAHGQQPNTQVSFALGGGGGPNPFDPNQFGTNPNHYAGQLPSQRPMSSSASSTGVFRGNPYGSPTGFGNVGPTPRTPPPMHDRVPRGARTDGSISRIRSIPSSPRGSPSSAALRGAEWYRAGSGAGLGTTSGPGTAPGAGAGGSQQGPGTPGSGSLEDLLHAAQSAFRPGQEGRALVQSRIQQHSHGGRRSDLRGLASIPSVGGRTSGGKRVSIGGDDIPFEHEEDDNDSLPYSEDESGDDEGGRRHHADDDDIGDESFAKKMPGSPKRRRTSAALNSPSKRMAKGRSKASTSGSVPGSPSKDRTPRPPKGKSGGGGTTPKASDGSGTSAGAGVGGLTALDLLADQAAASSTQSQYSGDSGSEHQSQPAGFGEAPIVLGGGSSSSSSSSARRSGADGGSGGPEEEGMDVEPTSPPLSGVAAANASHEKRSTYTRWSAEEDTKLRAAIKQHGQRWELVSRAVETRSYHQCRQRYLLLRRKEAAKSDGTGGSGVKPGASKVAGDGNGNGGAFAMPGSPSKAGSSSGGNGGSGSGSRSGRSNSEGEEVDEIEEEEEVETERDGPAVELGPDELLTSQAG
ncbi:hypothetical protein A4X06_0g3405 [Tilletia controversa]|uniref:Myb-like domain-containing protein n=1 Tax=Tilletia controversa TaxID=13291 RepID=A0A8X7MU60_9BASI|nr:hypothetical protein CF328_g2800 [Tilletia controversa]KAE8249066.1 hypothetical protein A4X06_0g3405 [Tilletia controversa]CAD6974900.1 unnamed protein product [Tilletia controversa]